MPLGARSASLAEFRVLGCEWSRDEGRVSLATPRGRVELVTQAAGSVGEEAHASELHTAVPRLGRFVEHGLPRGGAGRVPRRDPP